MTTLEQSGLFTRHARGDGDGGRGFNQLNCISTLHLGQAHVLRAGAAVRTGFRLKNARGKSQG